MSRTNQVYSQGAPSRSKVPALSSVLMLVTCGVGGYYLYDKSVKAEDALTEARQELATQVEAERARAAIAEKALEEEKVALQKKAEEATSMQEKLATTIGKNEGEFTSVNGRLTLQLVDEVLFRLGEAELTDQGKSVLSRVGTALQEYPENQVWVQGHTDDAPVSKNKDKFATNWELSTARAVTVVRFLQEEVGVESKRLAAVGFGEYRPVSKKSDRLNRRIEIVLFPSDVSVTRK